MKTLKQLERLHKAHKLIKQAKTGTPKELSKRLHISEREVYRTLEYLKEIDAEISFSRHSNTYYYKNDFELFVNISVHVSVQNELVQIHSNKRFQK